MSTSIITQAGLGYAVGGPEGATKGALFGAAFGGVNEAQIRGVTIDSITGKINMPDMSNLQNRFMNRFFPDWNTPIKISEVGTFKETQVYDMNPPTGLRQPEETFTTYKPTGLDTIPQRQALTYSPEEYISSAAEPIKPITYNKPTYVNQPNFDSWGFERTNNFKSEPTTIFNNQIEQPLMQKEFSIGQNPRQTTYANPNQFGDAKRLFNSWGYERNTGITSPTQRGQIDIYGKPVTDIDIAYLDQHTLERINTQPQEQVITNPHQKTSQTINPFTNSKNIANPFSLASPNLKPQTATTNPFRQTTPFINIFATPGVTQRTNPNPLVSPSPKSQPNPFIQPVQYPQPDPYPKPTTNETNKPYQPPNLPFLPLGAKGMEFGGNKYDNPFFGGIASRKREYPILTASEFWG